MIREQETHLILHEHDDDDDDDDDDMCLINSRYTGCPTRYRSRYFFDNSNTNKDIATKFEQQYVLFFRIFFTQ